jgi:acyl carrier protein
MTDICSRVEAILRHHSGAGDDFTFSPDTDLAGDLQLDSLDRIEIGLLLEDEFHIELPDKDIDQPEMGTLDGLCACIERKLKPNAAETAAQLKRAQGIA